MAKLSAFPTQHPEVRNPDGSVSNVKMSSFTFQDPGKAPVTFAIPTMVNGLQLTGEEALAIARKKGLNNYPRFSSVESAEDWINKNHGNIMSQASGIDTREVPRELILSAIKASKLKELEAQGRRIEELLERKKDEIAKIPLISDLMFNREQASKLRREIYGDGPEGRIPQKQIEPYMHPRFPIGNGASFFRDDLADKRLRPDERSVMRRGRPLNREAAHIGDIGNGFSKEEMADIVSNVIRGRDLNREAAHIGPAIPSAF